MSIPKFAIRPQRDGLHTPHLIPLGVSAEGEVRWDIVRDPHALIVGSLRSGRLAIQRNILLHCLDYPQEWAVQAIDTTRTGASRYQLTDLEFTVATDPDAALALLRDSRQGLLERIDSTLVREKRILLIIEEPCLAFGKLPSSTDEGGMNPEAIHILEDILRLGPTTGMHVLLETHHPELIERTVLDRFTCRIAPGRQEKIESENTFGNDTGAVLPALTGRGCLQSCGLRTEFQAYQAPDQLLKARR